MYERYTQFFARIYYPQTRKNEKNTENKYQVTIHTDYKTIKINNINQNYTLPHCVYRGGGGYNKKNILS